MTAIKRVIKEAGGLRAVSNYFGISLRAVSKWSAGNVPVERCPDLEQLTKGKVTCEELRPDVNWAILRNSNK